MSMESLIKKLQNIMRGDDLSGTVQYLKQMIWMIFLKIYDAQEEKWELLEDDYTSIIPENVTVCKIQNAGFVRGWEMFSQRKTISKIVFLTGKQKI